MTADTLALTAAGTLLGVVLLCVAYRRGLDVGHDQGERFGFECGWRAGYESGWVDGKGNRIDERVNRMVADAYKARCN